MFRFHILGLLRRGQPYHGYALMKEYNRRTGRSHGAGYFYRQLGELLSLGLVRSAPNPLGADRRRTPYEITTLGLEAFDEWFEEIPEEPTDSNVEQIARAMFFSEVEPEVADRVLVRWQRDLMEKAKTLQHDLQRASARHSDPADMRPMLIHRSLYRISADLKFLEEVGETLGNRNTEKKSEKVPRSARKRRRSSQPTH